LPTVPTLTHTSQEVATLRRQLVRAVERTCPRWLAADSDDLVQTALLRVMEIARRREGEAEFSSFYLRRAAYSVVVDEIRRRRRRGEVSLEPEAEGEEPARPSREPDPEKVSASRELGRAISDCLGHLVRPRRIATTLHLQGHRIREVGDLMGWTEKKAENLIYRGLADLRNCLKSQGIER
jgi:RNA polymerase sigma-70 factor (ECF subfamily)